jgi:UDP-3-O-[3-hydroxymyristoyl] N-acetylglucosamine deacetylase
MLGDIEPAAQHTLRKAVGCQGIGLHCGQSIALTLRPAAAENGIVFRRMDAAAEIPAVWSNTVRSPLCTVLSNREGVLVGTVEHLMAALHGAGIDNAVVELDGPEVPIMDGSAAPFLALIERAGIVEQEALRHVVRVLKPVVVGDDAASAALLPDDGFSMSFEIDFDNPVIRRQDIGFVFDADTFKTELSRARTFGLLDDVHRLQAAGLARGGSLDNSIVVSGEKILNRGGLRWDDEFVRHKLLDAFGDLYLAGGPLIGHFRGTRSGHAINHRLLAALFADPEAWCHTTTAPATAFAAPGWQDGQRLARL